MDELVRTFDVALAQRRAEPADDLLTTFSQLELAAGPVTSADVLTTLLEDDHETLHGALANLWFHLLADPERVAFVKREPRLMRLAYLEVLRHSTPVLAAKRYARHEVERFGRLLPTGALVVCSAAAANRDPRAFVDPDSFVIGRKDLCQREPRGTYRADGLPSGIAFGLGRPSVHPAVPEDRPRSTYAVVRDVAVRASQLLLDACPNVRLVDGAQPELRSLRSGEMHTCWQLPVVLTSP
jgi:cytochrome P450